VSGIEAAEHRLKRLSMRAARRGTKEMDLILGPFALKHLAAMNAGMLELFESLLDESDHDLYRWVTGQVDPPAKFAALIKQIKSHAGLS